MKAIIHACLTCAAVLILVSCASMSQDAAFGEMSGNQVVSFTVDGMACPNCAKHIEHELAEIPGIKAAKVSFSSKTATVALDPASPPSMETLHAAVAKWRTEHFAADEDPDCLDPARREEIKRSGS